MAKIENLPPCGPWEVDLVSVAEMRVEGAELAGVLLVVDRDEGTVRQAVPMVSGEDPVFAIMKAARKPVPPLRSGRPATIFCRPALSKQIGGAARALGARLEVTPDLPVVDEVAASLRQQLGPPVVLPANPAPWRKPLCDLARLAPWRDLPDNVVFRFTSGFEPLHDAIAVVLGMAGEQTGLAIYPTPEDYLKFLVLARGDVVDEWKAWAVHLDPLDEMNEAQRDACLEQGLVAGELGLSLLAFEDEGGRPVTEDEEHTCLVATQAVVGAYEMYGEDLLLGPTRCMFPTAEGEVLVATEPPGELDPDAYEPILVEEPHQVMVGVNSDGPWMAIKAAKCDIQRLARALDGVDALAIEEDGGEIWVAAWAGHRRIGRITGGEIDPGTFRTLREHGEGRLFLSAGGAKRSGLRERDFVATFEVEILEVEDDWEPELLEGASWDGPPETWPAASEVLFAYMEPLLSDDIPVEVAEQLFALATTIWSGVVLADHVGDPSYLDELEALIGRDNPMGGLFHSLVERKRTLYPQDRRLMTLQECSEADGNLDVKVGWSLP